MTFIPFSQVLKSLPCSRTTSFVNCSQAQPFIHTLNYLLHKIRDKNNHLFLILMSILLRKILVRLLFLLINETKEFTIAII